MKNLNIIAFIESEKLLKVYFLLLLMVISVLSSAKATPEPEIRHQLRYKLDSLQVQIQNRKRQGKSIEQLESRVSLIKDTLVSIRANAPQSFNQQPPDHFAFLPKPVTLFDWILVALALLASLCVFILLFTVLTSKRRKRKNRSKIYIAKFKPAHASKDCTINNSSSLCAEKKKTPLQHPSKQDSPEESIQPTSTVKDEISRLSQSRPAQTRHNSSTTIPFNDLVLRAANEGLNTQEISRRYQISADQISLILKVAQSKNSI
ncbi:hypothetical protein QA601_09145 [Chitinispirillales bacterium ANBcel5]|uniref:hypothetical protein n=1 Tax=Cellulosispirillum alkaliphilum TaxID=3039283 RepID=UPI002A5827CF|nr:hypothetical protein [Chitinispirillales bacterium ANBcel5]